jgi:trimeric autotransporter adhesin
VTLTCSDGLGHYDSSSVAVTVVTRQAYLSLYCISCHSGRSAAVVANYKISPHYTTTKAVTSCQFCHLPGLPDTAHYATQHPNDACKNCHTSFPPNTPGHIDEVGANNCVGCHDPHSTLPTAFFGAPPHFNSITSGSYPASYVSSRQVCSNCHSPNNDSMRAEENRQAWAKSGHGAIKGNGWIVKDFKTLDGCVRCHTTTGFIAYSTGKVTKAWGVASDKTKEVLGCNSCHYQDFALRNFKPYSSASAYSFRIDAGTVVSVPYKNSDYLASNVCLRCHTGTTSGEVIKRAFAFSNFTAGGRLLNHFMVGGGVMDNNIGYEFDGTPRGKDLDFNKGNTWHAGIGSPASKVDTGTGGACVVCHMSAPGEEHGFAAAFSNLSTVVSLPAQTVCDKCHPSQLGGGPRMSVSGLNGYKKGLAGALAALKVQLTVKGLNPDGAVASWGASPLERSNNMGAYYNYMLLKKADPAAYIHNSTYAKRLIQYSIDWLDNGLLDDSAALGIHALPGLSLDAKSAAVSYLGLDDSVTTNCVNCHQAYYN